MIFVVIGIICLFVEAIACLRRRSNTKLTLAGMVFLSVSVIGYIITEILLRDKDIPIFITAVWIILLWAYLICNVISAIILHRKKRKGIALDDEDERSTDNTTDDKKNV